MRSFNEVARYRIEALDGHIGHIHDFLVDVRDWSIRYFVVDTKDWWRGRNVVVSPRWISAVDWGRATVDVNLDRETIRRSPEYHP